MIDYNYEWINVYKPKNIGSFEVVKKIKKRFNFAKIGHAGTLDPGAEGVLPIAINKTTKLISLIVNKKKNYEFEIKWGEQTSTDDRDGKVIGVSKNIPSVDTITKHLIHFKGDILQKPPLVSAVKINGVRAYKKFRNNEVFQIDERKVKVYDLDFVDQPKAAISKFNVQCGKGFYVRSLARDLGESLKTKAHIYSLKRVKVGNFIENNSILLDDLLKMRQMADGIKGFHKSTSVLDDIPAFDIGSDEMLKDLSNGKKINIDFFLNKSLIHKDKKNYFATSKGKVISLGVVEGVFFKPKKILL